jgi:excisionase family DNA binding protein
MDATGTEQGDTTGEYAPARSPLMRVAEVAEVLGLSRKRCYELVAAGAIPSVRVSQRSIRVPRVSLDAYLAALAERSTLALQPGRASVGGS